MCGAVAGVTSTRQRPGATSPDQAAVTAATRLSSWMTRLQNSSLRRNICQNAADGVSLFLHCMSQDLANTVEKGLRGWRRPHE